MPIVKRFYVGQYIGIVFLADHMETARYHNGYVILPKGHPSAGKNYEDINMEVHGGLTFGTKIGLTDGWLPQGLRIEAKGRYMYGFDCVHAGDAVTPDGLSLSGRKTGEHYWTADEVEAEVRSMIKQFQRKRPSRRKA